MISLVPIYFIYLFKTKRTSLWNHLGLWILAVGLPMLPFLILDPHTLLHNMIFHYTTVIKHYAWNTPGVMDVSFGLTPILVQCHLQRFVGLAQGILLLGFYLMVFWKMNNRDQWLMSMPYALLLFSFTTIWPVVYLFLDVFLFMTSVILVTMRWKAEKSIALSKVYAISLGFIVGIAIFSTYIKSIE